MQFIGILFGFLSRSFIARVAMWVFSLAVIKKFFLWLSYFIFSLVLGVVTFALVEYMLDVFFAILPTVLERGNFQNPVYFSGNIRWIIEKARIDSLIELHLVFAVISLILRNFLKLR